VDSDKIRARSKWKEVYPAFANDERYLNMLGNPGSNPLELFWDVVDHLDQELDAKIAIVDGAISRYNAQHIIVENDNTTGQTFTVGPETTEEKYMKIIQGDDHDSVKALAQEDLHCVFTTVRENRRHRLLIAASNLRLVT